MRCWTLTLAVPVGCCLFICSDNPWVRFECYFLIAGLILAALGQLRFMSEMMSTFEAVLIIPIYQCTFMITLIICGAVYFDEFGGECLQRL